jgi:hypothetical protein
MADDLTPLPRNPSPAPENPASPCCHCHGDHDHDGHHATSGHETQISPTRVTRRYPIPRVLDSSDFLDLDLEDDNPISQTPAVPKPAKGDGEVEGRGSKDYLVIDDSEGDSELELDTTNPAVPKPREGDGEASRRVIYFNRVVLDQDPRYPWSIDRKYLAQKRWARVILNGLKPTKVELGGRVGNVKCDHPECFAAKLTEPRIIQMMEQISIMMLTHLYV